MKTKAAIEYSPHNSRPWDVDYKDYEVGVSKLGELLVDFAYKEEGGKFTTLD